MQYNLKIIAGFWMQHEGSWDCSGPSLSFNRNVDYEDPALRADILNRFAAYV